MKFIPTALLLFMLLVLVACHEPTVVNETATHSPEYWTQEEIDKVHDLSELGEMSYQGGHLSFGGKLIRDSSAIEGKTYGRTHNLLNLDDMVLSSFDINLMNQLVFGDFEEAAKIVNAIGVDVSELDVDNLDHRISLNEFRNLVDERYRDLSPTQPIKVTDLVKKN